MFLHCISNISDSFLLISVADDEGGDDEDKDKKKKKTGKKRGKGKHIHTFTNPFTPSSSSNSGYISYLV